MIRSKNNLFKSLYFIAIAMAAIYCFKRPLYNWDLLPYTYLVLKIDHHNSEEAFHLTYKLAKENIPPKEYKALTDSSNIYRYTLSHDPETFDAQLPFYVVKPLYTGLIYLFYKSGVPLIQATLLPSLISYLLIGFLLFHWLGIYLRSSISFIIAFLMMISSPLVEVAKLSSPDCLSAFLLLFSFYFILKKPVLRAALLFMLLSVFARLDNIITCLGLIGVIYASKKWEKIISTGNFLLITMTFICSYFLVSFFAYQYGWSILFYNDFADHLHPANGSKEHFSTLSYLRLMYEHILSGINHSYLVIFLALIFLNFNENLNLKNLSFEKAFLLFILSILFIRLILYPDVSDRFYIPFYLIIVILTAKKFSLNQTEINR